MDSKWHFIKKYRKTCPLPLCLTFLLEKCSFSTEKEVLGSLATEPGGALEGPRPQAPGQRGVAPGHPQDPPRNGRWVIPSCQLLGAAQWGQDRLLNSECPRPGSSPKSSPKVSMKRGPGPPAKPWQPSGRSGPPRSSVMASLKTVSQGSRRTGSGTRPLRSRSLLRHLLATCPETDHPPLFHQLRKAGFLSSCLPRPAPSGHPALSKSGGC